MLARRLSLLACAAVLAIAAKEPAKKKPAPLTADQKAAQSLLKRLNLHDRIAQLVFAVADGDVFSTKSPEYERYRRLVREVHIGGLIVNNSTEYGLVRNADPHAMAVFLNQMQRLAKTPLLVGSDFERAASMRVRGGTRFPVSMAFAAAGDPDYSRYEGLIAAREARAVGVHWIFAPVADVNNNPANPVINVRSYGEDPAVVSRHVRAFIEGARSDPKNPVLVTAKHFPGHGDTDVDSHFGLPHLAATRERINEVELKPFREAIAAGVDSIMTAHIEVPALDADRVPATVSPRVLNGLLREELGFENLIVTDSMQMMGLTSQFNNGEAAVRSIAAGADVLLMPPDSEHAIRSVMDAVLKGRISRKRIDDAAMRVLTAKYRVGVMKKKLVDLDGIADVFDFPEAAEKAQHISERAVTLVRNEGNVVPLSPQSKACLIITQQIHISQVGQRMIAEFRKRVPQAVVAVLDAALPLASLDAALGDPTACSAIVVESSVTSMSSRLPGELTPFVLKLTEGTTPVVFVSLGNPYLLAGFPKVSAYIAAYSQTVPTEIAVVKALFGEIPITGRLPVSIPGFATLNEGIQLPARSR